MISLSKIIKREQSTENPQIVTIGIQPIDNPISEEIEEALLIEESEAEKAIIAKAKEQANQILEDAKAQFEAEQQQIAIEKERWQEERIQWVEQAKQEGYEIGYEKGLEAGKNEYIETIQKAEQIVLKANDVYSKQIEEAELEIVSIGLKVAEKIIGHELNENTHTWIEIVKRAIKEVRDQQNVKIYVHPNQFDLTLQHQEELKDLFQITDIRLLILPNDDLQEFACIVESPFGQIDATIDNQLNELKDKLVEKLEEMTDGPFNNLE